ncbi:FkbM family methyltransferase [Congregibacter brevis]|uniref:FkbM family methyltransferase n=1 Tax=Congregibacter brevis TaxID=3081201 RepID=A0ABZ0IAZ7_9GAMM|nr:FkbM family methyltransferase [Congregibacter sp. IMCC45268]
MLGETEYRVNLNPLVGLKRDVVLATHRPDDDLVSRKIHAQRIWEPFETRLWIASQRPDDIVVDVGANLGYFSVLSAVHENQAQRVLAFEPAADNVSLLQQNLQLNKCDGVVELFPVALGDSDSGGSLHRNDDNRGDHQIYPGDGIRSQEPITVRRGSDLLAHSLDHIDLLKVDTQGSEYAVMQGLFPLLQASVPKLRILLELTPYSLQLANSSGRALVTLIANLGLPLWIVDHVDHRLVSSDASALCEWADNVDACTGDRGFMNIYAGTPPDGLTHET